MFKAYDEALKEKSDIIDGFEKYVQKFNKRVTEVMDENKRLNEFVAAQKNEKVIIFHYALS